MVKSPTLAWERVGDQFYRTLAGPGMAWDCPNVTQWHIRVAPGGGVIAAWEREGIIRRAVSAQNTSRKGKISLFSATGQLLGVLMPDDGVLKDVLVTVDEEVIAISATGIVRHFTNFDGEFTRLRLPSPAERAEGYNQGYIVQCAEGFVLVKNDKVRELEALPSPQDVREWAVIPPVVEIGQPLQVLADTTKGLVLYNLETGAQRALPKEEFGEEPVTALVPSPDATSVAVAYKDHVKIWTADFHHEIQAVEVSGRALKWVGSEAIALKKSDDELTLVDLSNGASVVLDFEEAISLLTEVDCARAIGATTSRLIGKVPSYTVDVFKLGSTTPAAMLLASVEQHENASPRAEQSLKLIGTSRLPAAIDSCISAALSEHDPRWQKRLMRAAAFGKLALTSLYDPTFYVSAIDKLRIANTLRTEAQMFTTVQQLDAIGNAKIVKRLERRKKYASAVAIAGITNQPKESVYSSWALSYIHDASDKTDEELESELLTKLSKLPHGIAYAPLARKALEEGRPKLSTKLLEQDPVAEERIVLLMELGQHAEALTEATQSGNPHLVWYVLSILHDTLSLSEFLRAIGHNETAVERYEDICRLTSTTALHDFLYQMDLRTKSLEYEFEDLTQEEAPTVQQLQAFEKRCKPFKKLHTIAHVAADWSQLVSIQQQLMIDFESTEFIGKSAADTVYVLLKQGQKNRAQKLKSTFHISDRQYWWLQLRALVDRRDWDAMWDLAGSKRPPIGYKPFYDACFRAGNLERAADFAALATELPLEERVRMLLASNAKPRAVEIASRGRAPELVAQIESETS